MGGSQYGGDSDAYARGDGYGLTSSRRNSHASGSGRRSGMSGMDSSSSSGSESEDLPPRRGGSYSGSRRGSMSARDIDSMTSGMRRLGRSSSRSSMRY